MPIQTDGNMLARERFLQLSHAHLTGTSSVSFRYHANDFIAGLIGGMCHTQHI